MTDSTTCAKFEQVIHRIDPTHQLLRIESLTGGVSAQVTALEIAWADGQTQKLLVRQHGEADHTRNPHIAADEYTLLHITHAAGLPTPKPYHVDESGAIFQTPYIVMEYIEGATEFTPVEMSAFIAQCAATLINIHRVDTVGHDLAFLRNQTDDIADKLRDQPTTLDDSLDEGRIRETLAAVWPLPPMNQSVLLHGDYWPGNLLWRDGRLVGVIDWEDARVGDPLGDVANSRLELLWAFGLDAVRQFTTVYQSMTSINFTHLPYWDLYAALRHIGKVDGWGLDSDTQRRMHTQHKQFIAQAFAAMKYG